MKIPIALVDCNNFYASCEKVFNPKLNGKPVVVLSNNDGIIIARSAEAKALGIKMGEPLFKIEHLIKKHNVNVFSSNYTLYGDMSYRVMNILEKFSPDVEIYSIDEAFVNLHGLQSKDLTEYCKTIRKTILQWTGLPVSVGVAYTKTLAKVANHKAKKEPKYEGVCSFIGDEKVEDYLKNTEVEDIWGVGRQYAKLLKRNGIDNAFQLTKADDKWIRKNMTVMGLRTVYELRGQSCINLEYFRPAKKAIISSRSFGRATHVKEEVFEAVATFTSRAAEKMRRQRTAANMMSVFLRTNPFNNTPQYHKGVLIQLPVPLTATNELLFYAEKGMEKIFRDGFDYKKVGVMLAGLVPKANAQQGLFDTVDREKLDIVTKVVDQLNDDLGTNALFFASCGTKKVWKTIVEKKSPRYTTNWDELPLVKADK